VSSFLAPALEYASNGWPVFPLQPREKQPLGALAPHGCKDATTDLAQVIAWWTAAPDANIGVATGGGRWVLDLDDFEARERLEAAGVTIPEGVPASTTGKGAHLWFAGDMGNRTKVVEKVDVRGTGGYVVAPPSIHPNGSTYKWVGGIPPFAGLPAAPTSLTVFLGTGKKPPVAEAAVQGNWVVQLLAGVGEGGRDDACTRLAGYFLGKGVPAEVVEVDLVAWAARCTPPFPADQVSKCVGSVAAREGDTAATRPSSVADLLDAALRMIHSPVRNFRTTGLANLDAVLEGGFEPGTTTLIGGRPGTGKTALKLQIARHVAGTGVGVLFVSLEMGATRLVRRMLSQTSGVPFLSLKNGDLIEPQRVLLQRAAEELRGLPFWIETKVPTVERLAEVLDTYEPGQVGLVLVDYLQKLQAPRVMEGRQRVEHVSNALTQLAVQRNLPLVVSSSLSRPDNAKPGWRPSLSSLRESGQLEHDGDNVILLYREPRGDVLEVDLAKQRDGDTGKTILWFDGSVMTFRESA